MVNGIPISIQEKFQFSTGTTVDIMMLKNKRWNGFIIPKLVQSKCMIERRGRLSLLTQKGEKDLWAEVLTPTHQHGAKPKYSQGRPQPIL